MNVSIDERSLAAVVQADLARMPDARIVAYIQTLLVEPSVTMRGWDYGEEREEYPCWTVLSHPASNTGIAYCEHGFGPRCPWGLVNLDGSTSIGMDSGWYTTFLEAFFESKAITDLPIWRVFRTKANSDECHAITAEGEWNSTWALVTSLRKSDPFSRYECQTSIKYDKE